MNLRVFWWQLRRNGEALYGALRDHELRDDAAAALEPSFRARTFDWPRFAIALEDSDPFVRHWAQRQFEAAGCLQMARNILPMIEGRKVSPEEFGNEASTFIQLCIMWCQLLEASAKGLRIDGGNTDGHVDVLLHMANSVPLMEETALETLAKIKGFDAGNRDRQAL